MASETAAFVQATSKPAAPQLSQEQIDALLAKKADNLIQSNASFAEQLSPAPQVIRAKTEPVRDDNTIVPEIPKKKDEPFYHNIFDFVDSYICVIYATKTSKTDKRLWLKDWWRYPAVFARLYSLHDSWEQYYKEGKLASWFLSIGDPMMRQLMDKDTGVMAHYVKEDSSNVFEVKDNGGYLEFDKPDDLAAARAANGIRSKFRHQQRKKEQHEARINKAKKQEEQQ
jgi:hypothetical protein